MHNLLWLKQVFIWMVWFYKLLIFLLHTFSMGVKTGGRLDWEQTVHLHYVQWCYFRLLQQDIMNNDLPPASVSISMLARNCNNVVCMAQ